MNWSKLEQTGAEPQISAIFGSIPHFRADRGLNWSKLEQGLRAFMEFIARFQAITSAPVGAAMSPQTGANWSSEGLAGPLKIYTPYGGNISWSWWPPGSPCPKLCFAGVGQ